MTCPRVTTLALALLLAACAQRPMLDDVVGVRTALEDRQETFLAAIADRNPERVVGHFADDAMLHIANRPAVHGREAIGTFYGNLFRFLLDSQAQTERLHLSATADLAYGSGAIRNRFASEGEPVDYSGKFLLVWRRDSDGEWRIVAYSVSNDSGGR